MTTTQLGLYQGALSLLGDRGLGTSGLAEDRDARYALDDVYAGPPTIIDRCLQMGLWRFAKRTVSITQSVTASLGYQYGFARPTDFIRPYALWQDTTRKTPLVEYDAEGAVFSANQTTIVVEYISNHASYGGNLALWPADFAAYVEATMARLASPRIKADALTAMQAEESRRLADARSHSAMEGPPRRKPLGNWARARLTPGRMTENGR